MRRPQPQEGSSSISIRLPNRLLSQIDRFIRWFKKEYPGLSIGRPDVIRMAVERMTAKLPQQHNLLDNLDQEPPDLAGKSPSLVSRDEVKKLGKNGKHSPSLSIKSRSGKKRK